MKAGLKNTGILREVTAASFLIRFIEIEREQGMLNCGLSIQLIAQIIY
jgi:hypothetical protein